MKHLKLPWHISKVNECAVYDKNQNIIIQTDTEQTAEFIVEACNNHETLKVENAKLKGDVEKLKNALRRVKEWSDEDEDYFDDPGDFADHILATL